jgi:hypothetical protein
MTCRHKLKKLNCYLLCLHKIQNEEEDAKVGESPLPVKETGRAEVKETEGVLVL